MNKKKLMALLLTGVMAAAPNIGFRVHPKIGMVIPEEHIGHMTCAQYEKGVRRPVRCSIAITVLGLFTSVANLIFLLKDFENLIFTRELLFEAAAVMILALGSVSAVQNWQIKAKFTNFE